MALKHFRDGPGILNIKKENRSLEGHNYIETW